MRWLALIVLLAGCDRVFGLGDPYEDARSVTMGSDGPMPTIDGSDGSGTPAALIASFPLDGDYQDAVSRTTATCVSGTGVGCTFSPGHSSGQSVLFDGMTCLTFRLVATPESFSIALWVKPTTGATETLLARPASTSGDLWLLQEDNDSIYFQSETMSVTGTPGVSDTNWHAIAVTAGPAGSVAYLDGAVAGIGGAFTVTYNADVVYIGCNANVAALGNFDGLIDDVEIYDGILDQTAVMQLAQ